MSLRSLAIEAIALAQSLHTNGHVEDYARDEAERGEWNDHAEVALDALLDCLTEAAKDWDEAAIVKWLAYAGDVPFDGPVSADFVAVLREGN